jgi:hypothetical protein
MDSMTENVTTPADSAGQSTANPTVRKATKPKGGARAGAGRKRRQEGAQRAARPPGPKPDPDAPPGSAGAAGAAGSGTAGAKAEQPRRRKSGGVNPTNVKQMSDFLGAMHVMLAQSMRAPEMMLQEPEANALATSLLELGEQYDYALDPKTAALVAVGMCCISIYVPRLMVIGQRVAREKATAKAQDVAVRPSQTPPAPGSAQAPQPSNPPPTAAQPTPGAPPGGQVEMYGDPAPLEASPGFD